MRHFYFLILFLTYYLCCSAQWGGTQTSNDLSEYTSKKDIDYVGDNIVGHKFDIYYPNDNAATHNVIIHIYGSAWTSNNSKGSADLGTVGKAALEAGYIFITPNHRNYNDALYPAQINDIKALVRYLRGNAESLKIDDSYIAISGFSSGGHLASLMGVTRNVAKDYTVGSSTMDIEGTLGKYTDYRSWVDAVCLWSGAIDARYKNCGNPLVDISEDKLVGGCSNSTCPDKHALMGANTFIDKEDAPTMVVHGSADIIIPQCEGEMFYDNLKNAGVDCEYYPNSGGHGVNEDYTDEMITFFNRIRENSNPVVGISLSSSKSSIEPDSSITLSAKVTVGESALKKIEIYQDSKLISTITEEPYKFEVQNLELGTYVFNAVMTDESGKTYSSSDITVTVKLLQSPYEGVANKIPGKIEMERYDEGDDGFAFHDSEIENQGGQFREGAVDIVETTDGYALGYTASGEWIEYTINAQYTDSYEWSANVSSGQTSASFQLYIDDVLITKTVSIPQTANNSWDTYQLITGETPSISEGKHVLKVEITGDNGNIDYIEFKAVNSHYTDLSEIDTDFFNDDVFTVYSLLGEKIGTIELQENDLIERVLQNSISTSGIYVLRNTNGLSRLFIVK